MAKSSVSRKELESDPRFRINPEALDSLFRTHQIYSYELTEIPVGKIRRYKNQKLSLLTDTDNYRYLVNPDSDENKAAYQRYCKDATNTKDNAGRSEEMFQALMTQFQKEPYDPQKGIIIVDQYNCILDGLHRSCIFLRLFGADHPLTVLRMTIQHGNRIKLLHPLFELKQALFHRSG